MYLTDIYRTFYPKEANYTFFSNAHGAFSKMDHILGHKTSLNKFKNIEIISSIFSDHKDLKLETNHREKNASVAILISDKIDFKTKAIKRDKQGHFIILKGRIHQEDINIINIHSANIGIPQYIRKILEDFKKYIDSNTLLLGDFKTPLPKKDRPSKQRINKDIVALNDTLDQVDLTDI